MSTLQKHPVRGSRLRRPLDWFGVSALVLMLGLGSAAVAQAKPPPASGLRVVWVRELATDPAAPAVVPREIVSAQPGLGLWPRVERMRVQRSAEPASTFDVRGRRLPAVGAGTRIR